MNKHTKRNLLIKLAFIIASIMQPMQIKAADIDASSRKITVVADKYLSLSFSRKLKSRPIFYSST